MRSLLTAGVTCLVALAPLTAQADEVDVDMHQISKDGVGASIGTVKATDGADGLMLELDLTGLQAGPHGFHVHEHGSCDMAEKDGAMVSGLSAGGHYDPHGTGKHLGPTGEGHLGDLPLIEVGDGGQPVSASLTAPRLKVSDIRGRALMIHEGGDNYSDEPKPLGGGGARVACGVIPE
jgi:Cu-Zn family superoxide dismutase